MNEEKLYDIIIIGAGASGLMAAAIAKSKNAACQIIVLEKNPFPAKKIYATGNGRCNFLNRTATPKDYFCRETPGYISKVIASVFTVMPPGRMEDEFRRMGIVAAEEEGRLYPRSMQAKSVAEALLQELQLQDVRIQCNSAVKTCYKEGEVFHLLCLDGKEYKSNKVIFTTGGKSGCQYGSEGDGYGLARNLGHQIIKPIPALTQLLTEESTDDLFGVRAQAGLCLWKETAGIRQLVAEDEGEVQFTKEGVSGICTFNISRFLELEEGSAYELQIDVFTEYTEAELGELFLERRANLSERKAGFMLYGLLPDKLSDAILRRAGIDAEGKVKEISRKVLRELAEICKTLSFTAIGTKSWKESQVTAGGVVLSEVHPKTLESKLVEGLYFGGEILDVDGPCGGYNLGWAFASGYVAGQAAAKKTV